MLKKIHKLFFSESGYFSGKVENRFMMTLCEVCKKKTGHFGNGMAGHR